MIEKWQQTVELLLQEENFDLNSKITVVTNSTSIDNSYQNAQTQAIWKECILESIEDILKIDEIEKIYLLILKDKYYVIYEDTFSGNNFINCFWDDLLDANGIRIKTTMASGEQLTRIIVR